MPEIILPTTITKDLEWLYSIFALIKNGIVVTDHTSKILYANPVYIKFTGYSVAEVLNQSPGMMRSGYHDESFYTGMWQAIKSTGLWEGEVWNRNKSGKVFPVALSIAKLQIASEKDPYYLGIFNEILVTKDKDAAAINLAFNDLLTKLPNKLAAEDFFTRSVKTLLRIHPYVKDKLAIVYIDVDDFKAVNAQYGYLMGDKFLAKFASKLDLLLRHSDYLARLESDHFVIIMTDVPSDEELENFAVNIYNEFSTPFVIDGNNIYSNCSVGVAKLTDAFETLDELIKNAAVVEK